MPSFAAEFFVVFILSFMWHMAGITIGYHRLLAHRTFHCPKLVEYFFVLGGYLAFEGSPIWWATVHRHHHACADSHSDIHAPSKGLLQAFCLWMKQRTYPKSWSPEKFAPDLISDRLYRILEQKGFWYKNFFLTTAIGLGFRIILLALFGPLVAFASLLAGFICFLLPLTLNVVCHTATWGYRSYETNDNSRNVFWLGLLTFGEGWHNNHHAFPASARMGHSRSEPDFSWILISFLSKLGLASNILEQNIKGVDEYNNRQKHNGKPANSLSGHKDARSIFSNRARLQAGCKQRT